MPHDHNFSISDKSLWKLLLLTALAFSRTLQILIRALSLLLISTLQKRLDGSIGSLILVDYKGKFNLNKTIEIINKINKNSRINNEREYASFDNISYDISLENKALLYNIAFFHVQQQYIIIMDRKLQNRK